MQPTIEQKYPEVIEIAHETYDPIERKDGSTYFSHPEWVGDQAYHILKELQTEFPEFLSEQRVEAIAIYGYLHDVIEMNRDITPERIARAAQRNALATSIGYGVLRLSHDDDAMPYLQHIHDEISETPETVLVKCLDMLHNLCIGPKPESSVTESYIERIQEYKYSIGHFVELARTTFAHEPWLKHALYRALQIALEELSPEVSSATQTWLNDTLLQARPSA